MNKFEKFSGKAIINKNMLTKITGGNLRPRTGMFNNTMARSRPLTGMYDGAMVSGLGGKSRPMTMGPNG